MTQISRFFPTSCLWLCISNGACLGSVTTSMWMVQEERRNVPSVALRICLWSLSIFTEPLGWERNVLPGRMKRNTPRIMWHSPGIPAPPHPRTSSSSPFRSSRSPRPGQACLSPSTVPHGHPPEKRRNLGLLLRSQRTAVLLLHVQAVVPWTSLIHGATLTKRAESSSLTVRDSTLHSFPPISMMIFFFLEG